MNRTDQQLTAKSPLSQPGPHGYPMRFGVRLAGLKGFKIYGVDPKQPVRYIEWHTRRQILHESAHKKDKSPALVSVHANWPSWSIFPLDDDAAAFTLTVHNNKNNNNKKNKNDNNNKNKNNKNKTSTGPDDSSAEAADLTIDMDHTRCRPVTFQFELPVRAADVVETFEWRRAPRASHETRGIRKKALPMMETGDERPPEEKFVYSPSGSVLVRLGGNKRCAAAKDRPLGFTRDGEEIVASYTDSRDYRAWYYFQFWGSGATGELGETFTHVAVMSGLAVWNDEQEETARRNKTSRRSDGHGVSPMVSIGVPRMNDGPTHGTKPGIHVVPHGFYAPGHLAGQCGMP
ncbi:hypothetical protein C8A00DRAFT_32398 [Chaetomidium leptoderma]|uniref:Uncharacterized protein n=1 Tax=Chaetomidium leptoderma TaxID=669021 RepID=A0AAN6VNE4_9PEZI|nr:hypothetical protein C8A00DRAFT_32398 [Chaetomidium leptoderma]